MSSSSASEVRASYLDSLDTLKDASGPVIANLTELAYEVADSHPRVIHDVIWERLQRVGPYHKLPYLYLIDSIIKKTDKPYREMFAKNIVEIFGHVFNAVGNNLRSADDVAMATKLRAKLYKVRLTWSSGMQVFRPETLYALDVHIKEKYDPRWPVPNKPAARPATAAPAPSGTNIHINPAFVGRVPAVAVEPAAGSSGAMSPGTDKIEVLQKTLEATQRQLLELRQKKAQLELDKLQREVEASKAALAESEAALNSGPPLEIAPTFSPPEPTCSTSPGDASKSPSPPKTKTTTTTSSKKTKSSEKETVKKPKSEPASSHSSTRKDATTNRRDPRVRGKGTPDRKPAPEAGASSSSEAPPPPTIRNDSSKMAAVASKRSASMPKEDHDRKRAKKSSSPPRRARSPLLSETLLRKSRERSPAKSPRRDRSTKSRSPSKRSSPPRMKKSENPPLIPPKISEKEKKSFRIPKKAPGTKRSPSPTGGNAEGFQEEGPHVEFGKSKDQQQRKKNQQQQNKRSKLNAELFDNPPTSGSNNQQQNNKGAKRGGGGGGWAQIKQHNNHPQHGNRNQQRFGRNNQQDGGNNSLMPPFQMPPFGNNGPPMMPDFEGFQNHDPHYVESTVIPQIIQNAQDSLAKGSMSPEQFSNLMRQVMILKEQAMMKRAAEMHMQQGPAGPPFNNMQQQQQQMPPPGMPFGGGPGMPFNRPPPNMDPGFDPIGPDLPIADPNMLEEMSQDPYKSIEIDNHPRDIRFYAEVATCVMGDDNVRELSFQPDGTRRVILDGNPEAIPPLALDCSDYTNFIVGGVTHKIKIGAPTRELWVDGLWYECYFNKEIRLGLGQNFHTLLLEGPAPTVKIGESRADLCMGYVNIVINANVNTSQRLYLDSKPQRLDIDGKPHIFQLCEGLTTLLINGQRFPTNFGGMPLLIFVNGNRFFLRLTSLPRGVTPGPHIRLWQMDGNMEMRPPQPSGGASGSSPTSSSGEQQAISSSTDQQNRNRFDSETNTGAFDKLLSLLPPSTPTAKRDPDACSESSYKCDDSLHEEPMASTSGSNQPASPDITTTVMSTPKGPSGNSSGVATPGTPVNMNDLWQNLVSAGLITSGASGDGAGSRGAASGSIPGLDSQPSVDKSAEDNKENVKQELEIKAEAEKEKAKKEEKAKKGGELKISHIELKSSHISIKTRQDAVVNMVYDPSAHQCKNCGLRFPSSAINSSAAYKNHLDWHFRMKRREKERNLKGKTQSRDWYFKQDDWIVSEEIEDEEKDENEREQTCSPDGDETPSVLVDAGDAADAACPICGEDFVQDYREAPDTEAADDDARLHFLNAVRAPEDGRIYHPQCHADLKKQGTRSALMHDEDEDVSMTEDEADKSNVKSEAGVKEEEQKPMVTEETTSPVKTEANEEETVKEEPMETGEAEAAVKEESTDPADDANVVKEEPKSPKAEKDDETASASEVKKEEEKEEEKPKIEPAPEPEELDDTVKTEPMPQQPEPVNLSTLEDPKVESTMAPPTATGIKFNITTNMERAALERRESVVSSHSESSEADSEMDPDGIRQNRPAEEAEAQRDQEKPRMKGKTFTELPPIKKSNELSGLCSIM